MSLIDEVTVRFTSGRGGSGDATFHREKHVPRGGPNGADGGRGGSVFLVADRHLTTLYDFKLHPHHLAADGSDAQANKNGKDAADLIVRVPVGTVVHDEALGEVIADLSVEGMKFEICRGGRGGLGNLHFTNSVRQSPRFAQKGAPGEDVAVRLELKMLADAGLIGLPNAGKSTLLGAISEAKPKVGAYPFTTISPNLGVSRAGDRRFVVADLPGLIEGAAEGSGLGHRFLKHTERTRVLVHVVDAFPIDETDPWTNFQIVEKELSQYSDDLAARPRVIALNKIDLQSLGDLPALIAQFEQTGLPIFPVSGATREGVEPLLHHLRDVIQAAEGEAGEVPIVISSLSRQGLSSEWHIERDEDGDYVVVGERIDRLVQMTDLENPDGVRYLHRRLQRIGVIDRLREEGAQPGDHVMIAGWLFEFQEW